MPTFSILLPSRNRLELLKLAIRSVLEQDSDDFEIIVSDNASTEDYAAHITSLNDDRIKYLRSETALSVTDNWNKTLAAAVGTYVLMLGDDDALTPGLLGYLARVIKRYRYPQVIYMRAYHYLYPDVVPGEPEGSLSDVANSELFVRRRTPFFLKKNESEYLARRATSFHHDISFNAQHFLWRRDFTNRTDRFFQGPYPDYFACFYTFATAGTILVIPKALVIIGISKRSFGFFFLNDRQDEGEKYFVNGASQFALQGEREGAIDALNFPGSAHYRNWLLTSLQFQAQIDPSYTIDFDLYRKIQIVEGLAEVLIREHDARLTKTKIENEGWIGFEPFVAQTYASFRKAADEAADRDEADRIARINQMKTAMLVELKVYYPSSTKRVPLEKHVNILDAFNHIRGLPADHPKLARIWAFMTSPFFRST